MTSITNQVGPKIEPRSVDYTQAVSDAFVDGVKLSLENSLPAAIAPLPVLKSLELINGRLSSEYMRLGVPIHANPFASSPMGPHHDYHMIAAVVGRLHDSSAKHLVALLQRPFKNISEQDNSHMRASLARENNMLNLLKARLSDADRIQEGITHDRDG